MRVLLACLLFVANSVAAPITVEVPPDNLGITASHYETLATDTHPTAIASFSYISAALDPQPGYELTSLQLYLGGYHTNTVTAEPILDGWHGTLNGEPIVLPSAVPQWVDVALQSPDGSVIASDVPTTPEQVGVILFGRMHGLGDEQDCQVFIVISQRDCQTREHANLAYRAVYENVVGSVGDRTWSQVPEPSTAALLGLVLAVMIWKRNG